MDLSALAILTTGAALGVPVQAAVNAVKLALPDLESWQTLLLAFLFGQAFSALVAAYSGGPLDVHSIAGVILAGLGATGIAIGATESHRAARAVNHDNVGPPLLNPAPLAAQIAALVNASISVPTVSAIADALEAHVRSTDGGLISRPPSFLPPSPGPPHG